MSVIRADRACIAVTETMTLFSVELYSH